jgi:hypothetical protein
MKYGIPSRLCLFNATSISTASIEMGKAEVGAKSRYLLFLSQRRGLSLRRGGGYLRKYMLGALILVASVDVYLLK